MINQATEDTEAPEAKKPRLNEMLGPESKKRIIDNMCAYFRANGIFFV